MRSRASVSLLLKRPDEVRDTRIAMRRHLLERAHDRSLDCRRHLRPKCAQWLRFFGDMFCHSRQRTRATQRRLTGEHLVQDAAERIDIARHADIAVTRGLLGTHVLRSPQCDAALRDRLDSLPCCNVRNPEIRQQCMIVREQDVLGLHVAVHETVPVRVVQAGAYFSRDANGFIDWQPLPALEAVSQRPTRNERGHIIEEPLRLPGIDERNDVRM